MKNQKLCDIAGYETEKKELEQVIDAFRRYSVYADSGAYMPKGLILSGEPGVGKTLFARVLANEITAPFFAVDGSETTVRELKSVFKKARKNSPAVVFIDELNAFVGDCNFNSDKTNKNLSCLLKLIDGLTANEGVLVIGATSFKYGLDAALLRSGRMDKHICISAPNAQSRREILRYYLSGVTIKSDNIDLERIAELMRGLTAADIKTLINESVMECVHAGCALSDDVLIAEIHKLTEKDINREISTRRLALSAVHDIGHLILSYMLLNTFDEPSVEFVSSTSGNSSIASLFLRDDDDDDDEEPEVEAYADSETTVLNKVAVLLGGLAAEDVVFGEKYLDARNDITSAINLINNAACGGLFGFEHVSPNIYYYAEISQSMLAHEEHYIQSVLVDQYECAKAIINKHKETVIALQGELIRKKRLTKPNVLEILSSSIEVK